MPASIIFREGKAGHHFEDTNPFLVHLVKKKYPASDQYETLTFSETQK